MYAANNPLVFVDPDGNESVRQAWGLDEPQSFWSAFGKNVAYNAWNAISVGTLGRQDKLVEQYEAGQISDAQYWGRTAINAGSSVAIVVAATATGGAAAGAAAGLGASATVAGVVGGAVGGLAAQGTTDIIEVAGTGTKTLQEVSAMDYLVAGATGGVLGGIGGAAAANPSKIRLNLNPNVSGLGALDDTLIQRGAQAVQSSLTKLAENSYQAGQRATTIIESAPPPSTGGGRRGVNLLEPKRVHASRSGYESLQAHPDDLNVSGGHRGRYYAAGRSGGRPELPENWDVHHSLPQQLRGDPRLAGIDIDAPPNLRGVPGYRKPGPQTNMHSHVDQEWRQFLRSNPNATREELLNFRAYLDWRFQHTYWESQANGGAGSAAVSGEKP